MEKITDLSGKHYLTCAACMGVYADALSYANANIDLISKTANDADNIIVLSCQVTDLAILNDFRTAEKFRDMYPEKKVYISGCLAQRLDIDFPDNIGRLEQMRCDKQHINDKTLVNFEKPFWVHNFNFPPNILSSGNIFRDMYPLRIGKGCSFDCTYCTIKMVRGKHEIYDIDQDKIDEFLSHDDVVLIADSPTVKQVKDWCNLAIEKNKPISLRNIEPQVVIKCKNELYNAANKKVLKIFHSPIQSNNPEVLKDMNRDVSATMQTIELAEQLKLLGVIIATNIIIDYKGFEDDYEDLYSTYDYISWNPLWDGVWNREKAEERFRRYILSDTDFGKNEDYYYIIRQDNIYFNSIFLNKPWYRKLFGGKWILIEQINYGEQTGIIISTQSWTKIPLSYWYGNVRLIKEENYEFTGVKTEYGLLKMLIKNWFNGNKKG